jgi:membrane protein required for colicin V production
MIVDIIFFIVLLLALIHGFRKGIIHSIVSLLALVIGIMAAVRLSELAAVYLDRWFNVASRYLPLISFIAVFIGIYLLFRLLEQALEGLFKMIKLNFINQSAGALVWGLIWTMLFSTILFYINNMELFSEETKKESIIFEQIEPLAPKTIEMVGKVVPPVKNIFNTMEIWFDEFKMNHASDAE